MKTIVIFLSMMTLFVLNGFGQKTNVTGLLENKETRTEIFNTIMNDHELMTDFMNAMHNNEHAMMMMKGNNQMMGEGAYMSTDGGMDHQHQAMRHDDAEMGNEDEMIHQHQMMDHTRMMNMLKDDPEMMQDMMGAMMDMCRQDLAYCSHMADMMTEHPDMMQMGLQRMKEKGMIGPDGNVKMMDPETHSGTMGQHHSH